MLSNNETNPSNSSSNLGQGIISSLTKSGSDLGENVRDSLDIMKELLILVSDDKRNNDKGNDDKENKLKAISENFQQKDGDKSDLALKIMFGIAGLALIAVSGGAGIAVVADGVFSAPILPEILNKGKEFLLGKDGDQQNISQDSLAKDLPKKMLALSLFEFANSDKSDVADIIFSKKNSFAEKIKDYIDSLSKMSPEQRTAELNSLKEEVTKTALALNQTNLSEKIDAVFVGLNEVLERKNLEKKEGDRDILDELKKNLSVRSIVNSDGSVTTSVSETSKVLKKEGKEGKEGNEGNEGSTPSSASASRVGESALRAQQIKENLSASLWK